MSDEATHTATTTEIKGEVGSEINEVGSARAAKRPKHEVIILTSEDEESSEPSAPDAARPPCISPSAAKRLLAHDKARYGRARGIFANQEIDQRSREGLKLEARVQGRERSHYRITITFNPAPSVPVTGDEDMSRLMHWRCTCPDWGSPCKHVGAVLLLWAHSPGSFPSRSTLAELLQPLSKEELMRVLLNVAEGSASTANHIRAVLGQQGQADSYDEVTADYTEDSSSDNDSSSDDGHYYHRH